jgi:Protein of unknown function (DUF2917)
MGMHGKHAKGATMQTDLNLAAITLPRHGLHRLDDARGVLVSALTGTLWITQQGDARDIVLEAGDDALIEHDGLTLVTALADARFVLTAPLHAARVPRVPQLTLMLRAMN